MKNHFIQDLTTFTLLALQAAIVVLLTSCVSVQLPFGTVPKAEKALVTIPNSPFVSLSTSTADEAWISEKTGNTISYLSECKKSEEKVEEVALDAARAVDNAKILKTSSSLIDSKHASEVLVSGKVDSHKVKMAVTAFKNRDCTFSLTYGGLEQNFEEELKEFVEFKKGFKIP